MKIIAIFTLVIIQSCGFTYYYASESKRILPSGLDYNPFVVAGFINTKMVLRKCEICNKSFKTYNCYIKKGQGNFCSKSCASIYKSKNSNYTPPKGKDHHRWNKKLIRCKYCKNGFMTNQKSKQQFCSVLCYSYWQSENVRKENHHNYIGKELICKQCERLFIPKDGQYKRKYCSKKCYVKYQKGKPLLMNIMGKRWVTPRTYHLKPNRVLQSGAMYNEWRAKIYERDNYTCQDCGESGGKLNAHHINPVSMFPELLFELTNGMTLCHECHKKTDSYGWKNYWNNYINKKTIIQLTIF
ncbi:MAG: HNH endonuclease [Candidatus Anammoxibacter sp.]